MDFLFTDSADGTRLRIGRLGTGKRDLLIVHGLAEHAGRYQHVAKAAADRGWRVNVLELRGHGHSGGRRGFVSSWGDYRADLRAAAALCETPPSIIAHSMGGLVTLDTVRDGLGAARVALSNPLLGVRVQAPKVKVAAGRFLSRYWPTLSLGNELDPGMLSRDKAVGEAYSKDPLVYNTITPRWFTEMEAAVQRVLAARFSTPIALFCSDTDPITDPVAAKGLASRNEWTIKDYPGMLHELFNEVGKEQVIQDVLDWLN